MSRVMIVEASPAHVAPIAARMREEDKKECMGIAGMEPKEALSKALRVSEFAWTGLLDGKPEAMFGVSPITTNVGGAWMLGTDAVYEQRKVLLRNTRRYLLQMHRRYPLLLNYVSVTNEKAIRWLKWAGFVFLARETKGSLPVYQFARLEDLNNV